MKIIRRISLRQAVGIAVAASVIGFTTTPVLSQPNTGNPADATVRQEHMRQHLEMRLNKLAERLQITDAQQGAWKTYKQTIEGLMGSNIARPAPDADAASIARYRAELAAERAQKLSQLADATATLQQSLTPEQQQKLNEIARHMGRSGHSKRGGHRLKG